ncbi:MAG: hypothetical protein IPH60_18635 [Flavobacteriales bacterium]|nr:hypothetical protein [Flavobacteriales bacterium]
MALTVNLTPTATAFNNGPACVGGSVIFDGVPSAAGTYAWSGPNGFSSTMEDPPVVAWSRSMQARTPLR